MTERATSGQFDPARELEAVRREFAQGLGARVELLRAALERLSRGFSRDGAEALYLPAHSLKGTAASFGAEELVPHAMQLAALAHEWLETGAPPPAEVRRAAEELDRLEAAAARYRTRTADGDR